MNNKYNVPLSKACLEVRKKLELSQAKFALNVYSNQTEISFIERGFIPEDYRTIQAIFELYEAIILKRATEVKISYESRQ